MRLTHHIVCRGAKIESPATVSKSRFPMIDCIEYRLLLEGTHNAFQTWVNRRFAAPVFWCSLGWPHDPVVFSCCAGRAPARRSTSRDLGRREKTHLPGLRSYEPGASQGRSNNSCDWSRSDHFKDSFYRRSREKKEVKRAADNEQGDGKGKKYQLAVTALGKRNSFTRLITDQRVNKCNRGQNPKRSGDTHQVTLYKKVEPFWPGVGQEIKQRRRSGE